LTQTAQVSGVVQVLNLTSNTLAVSSSNTSVTNTVAVSGTVLTTPGNITNWDVISASLAQGVYTTMPSNLARVMSVTNSTGYTVYIKKATSGTAFALLNNNAIDLNLIANTNEVAIRQVDSVSPLVITAIYNY